MGEECRMATTGRPTGRPGKPVERHRLAGTGRDLPDAPGIGEGLEGGSSPDAPETLGPAGLELWHHVWHAGRQWLAVESDRTLVSMLCHAYDESEKLRQGIESGEFPRVYVHANGSPVTTPWVTQLKELRAQITSWLAAIGFSPSDRSRLGLAEVRVRDELDELAQRRDVTRAG
jgi:P27 family predicted phage terminase small subunit